MKRIAGLLLVLAPMFLHAQRGSQDTGSHRQKRSIGLGIRAGFNFADVTNAAAINASSRVGFNAGIFLAPASRILGSKTELIYSRRGYNYSSDTANGSVNLDYIALAQLMAIHITKYFEIDIGGQTAYLLHVKVDSGNNMMYGNAQTSSLLSYYNRFDYGFGGGVEIHPIAGLLMGGRYNISLSNLYKQSLTTTTSSGQPPGFYPSTSSINLKNNVIQLYAGYRF
jgi:hypothetical protein